MSEQHRRFNAPQKISTEVPEEVLRNADSCYRPRRSYGPRSTEGCLWGSVRVQIFSRTQRTPSVSETNLNN